MVDPVSNEGIEKAVEQTSVDETAETSDAGGTPANERSFDDIFASKTGGEGPDAVSAEPEVESVEGRDLEKVDEAQSSPEVEGEARDLQTFVDGLGDDRTKIDSMIERTMEGEELGQTELLEMQMLMYSYSQKVELASKTVDKATSGLQRMMQVQV